MSELFRSQADARFNSFVDPMNPVNMNPGNWGINSAYLTPAYAAPYRPQYQGAYGTAYGSEQNPSFGSSMLLTVSPLNLQGTNFGGNTYQQMSPAFNTLGNQPMDSAMSIGQKLVVPAVMTWAAFKYLNRPAEAIGKFFGSSLGRGVAQGLGASAGVTSTVMGAAGTVGRFAGGMTLPLAAATAGVNAIDKTFFENYIYQRQMTDNLNRNFAGITYGNSMGNLVNGRGLSRSSSASIANSLAKFGAQDMAFDVREVGDIADLSSRAGLFDATSSDKIVKQVKSITSQIKMVMQVANTSDFREAIEILGNMKQAGAYGRNANYTMTSIGTNAAIAGVSASRLMNTVGMQGQYLYGANGITPYMGQVAAGQSYASFASAFRSGLISPALMAQMGGPEGATQSAMAARLSALNTPYAQITSMNAVFGQGAQGNVVGNVNAMGAMMAGNPLQTAGTMGLHKKGVMSAMAARGPEQIEKMIHQIASQVPGAVGPNGKVSAEIMHLIAVNSGMMGEDESRAFWNERRTLSDSKTRAGMRAGVDTASIDSNLKFMQQNNMDMGFLTAPVNSLLAAGRDVLEWGAGASGGPNQAGATVGDSLEKWWTGVKFGDLDKLKINDLTSDSLSYSGKKSYTYSIAFQGLGVDTGVDRTSYSGMSQIVKLANKGDVEAKMVMDNIGPDGNKTILKNMVLKLKESGRISGDVSSIAEAADKLKYKKSEKSGISMLELDSKVSQTLNMERDLTSKYFGLVSGKVTEGSENAVDRLYGGSLLEKSLGVDINADENRDLREQLNTYFKGASFIGKDGVVDEEALRKFRDPYLKSNMITGLSGLHGVIEKAGFTAASFKEAILSGDIVKHMSSESRAIYEKDNPGNPTGSAKSMNQALMLLAKDHRMNFSSDFSDRAHSSISLEELAKQTQVMRDQASQAAILGKEGDNSMVDFTQFNEIMKKFDKGVGDAGSVFRESAQVFREAVERDASNRGVGRAVPGTPGFYPRTPGN